jgi:hypothetical protein
VRVNAGRPLPRLKRLTIPAASPGRILGSRASANP